MSDMPLALADRRLLDECEQVIERGQKTFVEVGEALERIRDARLYRETHATFEDYCRERWGFSRQRGLQLISAAEAARSVTTNVVIENEAQARELAKVEPERREEVVRAAAASPSGLSARTIREAADPRPHVSHNSGENEWYTPPEIIEAARSVMGSIDTDPATSEVANRVVKAERWFTKDDDGLKQAWTGNVWLNPPYAQPLIGQFVDALVRKYQDGEFDEACILVNNATETRWGQALLGVSSSVCFLSGRVKFLDPDGVPGAPLQGQMLVYIGDGPFAESFRPMGVVVRR